MTTHSAHRPKATKAGAQRLNISTARPCVVDVHGGKFLNAGGCDGGGGGNGGGGGGGGGGGVLGGCGESGTAEAQTDSSATATPAGQTPGARMRR